MRMKRVIDEAQCSGKIHLSYDWFVLCPHSFVITFFLSKLCSVKSLKPIVIYLVSQASERPWSP